MQLQQLAAAFIVFKLKNNEAKFDNIYRWFEVPDDLTREILIEKYK